VDFYHEINDSESVATAPKIIQQAYAFLPKRMFHFLTSPLMQEPAQEAV
jgi:hypothetical protein